MFQDTTTWDLLYMHPAPTIRLKIYMALLSCVGFVYLVKLTRVWRNALPFRLSRQKGNLAYVRYLEDASRGLKHWVGLIPLVWGLYASAHLYNVCAGLQMSKVVGNSAIFFIVRDFWSNDDSLSYDVFLSIALAPAAANSYTRQQTVGFCLETVLFASQ